MNARMIPLNKITPDPNQPRKHFSGIEALAQNMQLEGQIEPIEVDENLMIIVGERRYRAAKSLGWKDMKAVINEDKLPPYERFRRQMSENLHQSGSGEDAMDPMDTARAWEHLYELKTGGPYKPGLHGVFNDPKTGRILSGPFKQIAEEMGVQKQTVWEHLQLLNQPKFVQRAIEEGTPRTYFREADRAPEEVQQDIREKIAAGDYKSRDEIIQDVQIARKLPDLALIELERQKAKSSTGANRVLNLSSALALALTDYPLDKINPEERNLIVKQLEWLEKKLGEYLFGAII